MNHACARTNGGESALRPSQHNPARLFTRLGDDWDFTSHDSDFCRRTASAWNRAVDLLDTFREPAPAPPPQGDAEHEPGP
jgi:hypothetical protein